MGFWPVNEMIELVSGMPAPQFGDEFSRVRGSQLVQGSSGSVILVCFSVPQVEDHCSKLLAHLVRIPYQESQDISPEGQ
jgi:hypothetical protein